jgi:hypothetical protein
MSPLEIEIILVLLLGVLPMVRLSQLLRGRRYDLICFLIGYYIILGWSYLVILPLAIGQPALVPEVISSGVIALLTLALVWVELSKRPELKMLNIVPVVNFHIENVGVMWKADTEPGQMSKPSRLLGIIEASYANPDFKFRERTSFSVDVANIGYEEIVLHEYIVSVDGKRVCRNTIDKGLRTQERLSIDTDFLKAGPAGIHKVVVQVLATTISITKEIWFCISEDKNKLRYVDALPWKQWFHGYTERELKFKNDGSQTTLVPKSTQK